MLTRKIGKLIRGKTTPFGVISATVLGAMLGFVPGFGDAPGLIVALVALLMVVNANLFVAAVAGFVAKGLYLVLLPVTFGVGRVLIDGPTQPIVKAAVNAPVLAWFGLERYLVTGGVVMGVVVGVVMGVGVVMLLQRTRAKLGALEEGSERYKKITGNPVMKVVLWVFVGGSKGKKPFAEMGDRKVGNPVRVLGVVAAALLIGLVFVASLFMDETLLTAMAQRGLERANGATVDIERVQGKLGEGKVRVEGLAMADPNALGTDLLRAGVVEVDVSGTDLLRKRMSFDRIEVVDALSGAGRAVRGVLVGPGKKTPEPSEPKEGGKGIEEYVKDAKKWRERLGQVQRWLEKMSGDGREDPAGKSPQEREETLEERIAREIEERGYRYVSATHLIEDSPRVLVRELVVDGVTVLQVDGQVMRIDGTNLATEPWLVKAEQPSRLVARTVEGGEGGLRINTDVQLAAGLADQEGRSANPVVFEVSGLSVDRVMGMLRIGEGEVPVAGGTLDASFRGAWGELGVGSSVDGVLNATLRDVTVAGERVDSLTVPIGLKGPISSLTVFIDDDALRQALVKAGKDRLAKELDGKVGKAVDDALKDSGVGEDVKDKAKDTIDSLFRR